MLLYDRDILANIRLPSEIFREMFGNVCLAFEKLSENLRKSSESVRKSLGYRKKVIIADAASEPEANEGDSSQISRRLHFSVNLLAFYHE